MSASLAIRWGSAATLWLLATLAQAAHPLQTEDTATQGAGNLEIENGLSRTRSGGASADEAFQVQWSLGVLPELDLQLQTGWLRQGQAPDRRSGLSDSTLDLKWRFHGEAPWSLAVRGGLTLPTARAGLGLPRGHTSAHAVLVSTWDAAPFTAHANLGYARWPRASGLRRDARHLSAALMWAASDDLSFTAEVAADTDTDVTASRWLTNGLAGLIWTLRPGLDLDLGHQTSLRLRPDSRSWLLGLTWRFAI